MAPVPEILLVDDDPSLCASLQFTLGLQGFAVEAFESAETFIARAGPREPTCLIIDYRLPGMDGLRLLESLRMLGVAAPAVVITSNPTRLLRERVANLQGTLIEKPLLGDELISAIRSLTSTPAGADEMVKSA